MLLIISWQLSYKYRVLIYETYVNTIINDEFKNYFRYLSVIEKFISTIDDTLQLSPVPSTIAIICPELTILNSTLNR